jgi:putative transposase
VERVGFGSSATGPAPRQRSFVQCDSAQGRSQWSFSHQHRQTQEQLGTRLQGMESAWWSDGVYFNVRLDEKRTCVLVLIGATEDGSKELLAVVDGYRESTQS